MSEKTIIGWTVWTYDTDHHEHEQLIDDVHKTAVSAITAGREIMSRVLEFGADTPTQNMHDNVYSRPVYGKKQIVREDKLICTGIAKPGMYDVAEKVVYLNNPMPNPTTVQCVYCEREITPSNGYSHTLEISWHNWDDPDEDAQGQRRYSETTEWYCCGTDDGYLTLDCFGAVIKHGINAKQRSLIMIAQQSDVSHDVRDVAVKLLRQQSQYNREIMHLLADIDHYGRYDDNSPGQIGGGS